MAAAQVSVPRPVWSPWRRGGVGRVGTPNTDRSPLAGASVRPCSLLPGRSLLVGGSVSRPFPGLCPKPASGDTESTQGRIQSRLQC